MKLSSMMPCYGGSPFWDTWTYRIAWDIGMCRKWHYNLPALISKKVEKKMRKDISRSIDDPDLYDNYLMMLNMDGDYRKALPSIYMWHSERGDPRPLWDIDPQKFVSQYEKKHYDELMAIHRSMFA